MLAAVKGKQTHVHMRAVIAVHVRRLGEKLSYNFRLVT